MGIGYTLGGALIISSIWMSGHEYIGLALTALYIYVGFNKESNVRSA